MIISSFAQESSNENIHFISYNDNLIPSLYFLNSSNNFKFKYSEDGGAKSFLKVQPNQKGQIGVNVNYKYIDVSYGYKPAFLAENKSNKGSNLFNLSTRLYWKKWMQTLSFINQKGFYISNGDVELDLPKLRTTKYGGTTSYVFNDNFSFRTIANQREWQIKSAGSFIPNFSIYYTNFDLNDGTPSAKSDLILVSIAPAYYYNFVFYNKFLISAGTSIGVGFNSINGVFSEIYEWSSNIKIAYNTNTFFTFVNINYTNFSQASKAEIRVSDNISNFKVTVGYRFKTPKKVEEIYDHTVKKIGL